MDKFLDALRIEHCVSTLTETEILSRPEVSVWTSEESLYMPSFYPWYQLGNHYSYSPLPLILKKGSLDVDSNFISALGGKVGRRKGLFYSGHRTIDAGVRRVGKAIANDPKLSGQQAIVDAVADAMISDVRSVESTHQPDNHVVLVGGKDSLNLLLLPWEAPVHVLSAEPNYRHVCEFVRRNDLPCSVKPLLHTETMVHNEVMANACLIDLRHMRWCGSVAEVARSLGRSLIWKGQLADTFLTPYWLHYEMPAQSPASAVWRGIKRRVGGSEYARSQDSFRKTLWDRGAMWQGVTCSILRATTGSMVLSGYHGPSMTRLQEMIDLNDIRGDIRAQIGEKLFGRPVWYPTSNPAPPPPDRTPELSSPTKFFRLLEAIGISVKQ